MTGTKKKKQISEIGIDPPSTHNKQQAGIKSICTEERGKKLWQLQMCSNYGSKWYSPPYRLN